MRREEKPTVVCPYLSGSVFVSFFFFSLSSFFFSNFYFKVQIKSDPYGDIILKELKVLYLSSIVMTEQGRGRIHSTKERKTLRKNRKVKKVARSPLLGRTNTRKSIKTRKEDNRRKSFFFFQFLSFLVFCSFFQFSFFF